MSIFSKIPQPAKMMLPIWHTSGWIMFTINMFAFDPLLCGSRVMSILLTDDNWLK